MNRTPCAWFVLLALTLAAGAGLLAAAQRSPQQAEVLFESAKQKEIVEGKLQEAIQLYQRIVQEYAANRPVAAKALLQMGQCYERLGQADARMAYERLVRDFADQQATAAEARARLAALAAPAGSKTQALSARQVWAGSSVDPTGSPSADGRLLAFTDFQTGDVAIRDLATGDVRRVTKAGDILNSGDQSLFATFSPDSTRIAFAWLDMKNKVFDVRVIAADGTGLRTLYHNNAGWVIPLAWTADGKHVAVVLDLNQGDGKRLKQIGLVSLADGSLEVLASGHTANKISASPDGRYLVYDAPQGDGRNDIFLLSVRDKREVALVNHAANDAMPVWTPDGRRVIFMSDRSGTPGLWIIEVADGQAVSPPELLKDNIGAGYIPVGFSRQGTLFYGISTGMVDVYTAPVDPATCRAVGAPAPVSQQGVGANRAPTWSPDGNRLAYLSSRKPGLTKGTTIVIRSLEPDREREFDVNADRVNGLAWYPDGSALAFIGIDGKELTTIYRLDAQSGAVSTLRAGEPGKFLLHVQVTPDGRALVYSGRGGKFVTLDLRTFEEQEIAAPSWFGAVAASPDGRQMAMVTTDEKTRQMALVIMPAGGGEPRELWRFEKAWYVSGRLSWSPDGRFIVFPVKPETQAEYMCVSTAGGEAHKLGVTMPGLGDISVHPNGRRVAFSAGQQKTEIWALENFLPPAKR